MTPILLSALVLLPQPVRVEASLHLSALAWGHDPATFRALAEVESRLDPDPKRYGKAERWGNPPERRRWRYVGLMQTQHYPACPCGQDGPFPPGEWLLAPELSAWYGAAHLAGWVQRCGKGRALEAYNRGNRGCRGETDGSFAAAVMAARRRTHE